METDTADSADTADATTAAKEAEPEATHEMLPNPARVLSSQLEKVTLPPASRFTPVAQSGQLRLGVNVLTDGTPDEPIEYITVRAAGTAIDSNEEPDAEMPPPFVYNEDLED